MTLHTARRGHAPNAAPSPTEIRQKDPRHGRGAPARGHPFAVSGPDQATGTGYVGYSTPETYWTTRMTWHE
ncbi:hypothetical protein SALBM135S_02843 [Streptomyces alboniger]